MSDPIDKLFAATPKELGTAAVKEVIRLDEDTGLKPAAGETVGGSSPSASATVINISDAPEGWRSDPAYVYIGRGSKWGNRWLVGLLTRREVIERFENDGPPVDLEELRDKILVCHCAPLPCHGDVLVKWLNKR